MCGIVGAYGLVDNGLLESMMKSISHRGPDDSGRYIEKNLMLGHRRLSIIDLSTGKQPISNEDGSIVTVYNGEIYNYRELRDGLEKKGHRFSTNTDTEVIVHLYEEKGIRFLEYLRGMHAIAVWDSRNNRLILSRDHMGIKPLYYLEWDNALFFSSEIKAFLCLDEFIPEIDPVSAGHYLSLNYVPGDRTILKDVKKLEPGHALISSNDKKKSIQYWNLGVKNNDSIMGQCLKDIDMLLKECVEMRMMGDVPFGAYLSGGLDSSTIVHYMSRNHSEPIKTFSIGFGYDDVDETAYARQVAEHFGTDHHEICMTAKQALRGIPDIIWHLDEPVGDPAAVPTYFLSKEAKKKVKVVLTGEGGDEAFAGYRTYKLLLGGDILRRHLPETLRRVLLPWLVDSVPGFSHAKRYVKHLSAPEGKRIYMSQGHLLNEAEKKELITGDFSNKMGGYEVRKIMRKHFHHLDTSSLLPKLQYIDLKTWVSEDLLMKLDKQTMAWGIEGRVPLLDHRLIEYCLGINTDHKIRYGTEKYILKKLMSKRLPLEIIKRKKQGFHVPMHHWMMDEISEVAKQVLCQKSVKKRGILRPEKVEKLLSGRIDLWRGHQIWGLMTLELWSKMYIDGIRSKRIL